MKSLEKKRKSLKNWDNMKNLSRLSRNVISLQNRKRSTSGLPENCNKSTTNGNQQHSDLLYRNITKAICFLVKTDYCPLSLLSLQEKELLTRSIEGLLIIVISLIID